MAKYLVVHPVGPDMDPDAARPMIEAIKANLTPDAYWVRSSYPRESGKVFCEWNAKDAEAIRKVLMKAWPDLPTEGIYKIDMMLDSEDFR